jgi:hypothetical protein
MKVKRSEIFVKQSKAETLFPIGSYEFHQKLGFASNIRRQVHFTSRVPLKFLSLVS